MAKFNHVKWGDGLTVTDEGKGVIRVDAGGGGGGGGDGIQFDTDNEGNWLYIGTNDETAVGDGGSYGYGFQVQDESSGGIKMKTFAAILLETATGLELHDHGGGINIHTDETTSGATAAISIGAPTGTISIGAGEDIYIANNGAICSITMNAAGNAQLSGGSTVDIVCGTGPITFNVGGVPTFRLDPDGSVHGLASVGAITWDIV